MCREVTRMLKLLKSNRDMSVNEIKLTLAIEDPRARERRESMGIEVCLFLKLTDMLSCCMLCMTMRVSRDARQLHLGGGMLSAAVFS